MDFQAAIEAECAVMSNPLLSFRMLRFLEGEDQGQVAFALMVEVTGATVQTLQIDRLRFPASLTTDAADLAVVRRAFRGAVMMRVTQPGAEW